MTQYGVDYTQANAVAIQSFGNSCTFLAPVVRGEVAGLIRAPGHGERNQDQNTEVQRELILRVCTTFGLRLTGIHESGSSRIIWGDPSPTRSDPVLDEIERAVRDGSLTGLVVARLAIIGENREARDQCYRILRGAGVTGDGPPNRAKLIVADFLLPSTRRMDAKEWLQRRELAWQGTLVVTTEQSVSGEALLAAGS